LVQAAACLAFCRRQRGRGNPAITHLGYTVL
jgi:hypothetical protein